MRALVSKIVRWLASPRLAFALLLVIAALTFLATLVPQGGPSETKVAMWAVAHPFAGPLVRAFGFHAAYTSPVFLACVSLLAASTTVCSWRRTKVAMRRLALVRKMTRDQAVELAARPSFCVAAPMGGQAALETTAAALQGRRARVTQGDGFAGGGASVVGIVGSPVFHWALVLLFVVLAWGQLTRAEGLMGVGEGEVKPNAPAGYGVLNAGALYRWGSTQPSIGVERLRLENVVDGIDRGPTPTVVLYGANGEVLARGDAYPNHPLRYRSYTVHANDYGLSAVLSLTSPSGQPLGKANVLVDFSDTAPGGTAPGEFSLTDSSGSASIVATVTVPLDRVSAGYSRTLPRNPEAIVSLSDTAGTALTDQETLSVGQSMTLPDGATLRLDAIRYYARLSVVDDSSLPLVFAVMLVALGGLACSLLGSKYAVAIVAAEDDSGARLDVWYRDWRGGASGRIAFEALVRDAVGLRNDRRDV